MTRYSHMCVFNILQGQDLSLQDTVAVSACYRQAMQCSNHYELKWGTTQLAD